MNDSKKIGHTFLSGGLSATLVIPIAIARRQGLNEPSNVVIEETDTGILIRKVDLEKI
jgi:hypothetical protein